MKIFRSIKLLDRYKVEPSKDHKEDGDYVLFHEIETLRGYNYQRVFKGSYKECCKEKNRLETEKRKRKISMFSRRRQNG